MEVRGCVVGLCFEVVDEKGVGLGLLADLRGDAVEIHHRLFVGLHELVHHYYIHLQSAPTQGIDNSKRRDAEG